jgi:hypothetical protein
LKPPTSAASLPKRGYSVQLVVIVLVGFLHINEFDAVHQF